MRARKSRLQLVLPLLLVGILLQPISCLVAQMLPFFGRRRLLSSISQTPIVVRPTRGTREPSVRSLFVQELSAASESAPLNQQHRSIHLTNQCMTPPEATTPSNTKVEHHSEYERWVRRLYRTNLFNPVKLGLTNMKKLHNALGNPMDDPNRLVIHVAGTNGKGSVSLKIANALQEQGLQVGLFCSPHVSSFRERMQVNGKLISEDQIVELLPQIYDICVRDDIPATFFEITTALAFQYYAREDTQAVVLETGLGGRLDATNVVSNPALSVITSIGLEHTRILGDTVELIAMEKAGIIKPNRPVLVGPHCPQETLRQCTADVGGGPYYNPQDLLGDNQDLEITDYDEENQRIAKAALRLLKNTYPNSIPDMTDDAVDKATSIRPPCRFQQVKRDGLTVILDVAHNPPAMEYLVRKLQSTYPGAKFRFVTGMSADKDLAKCGNYILQAVADPSCVHLVEASHPRAAKLEAILEAEPALAASHHDLKDRSITKQVLGALESARGRDEMLVVCGSVFLMAEAREALGFDEPRDSDYIAEMAGAGLRTFQENFGNTTDLMEDNRK